MTAKEISDNLVAVMMGGTNDVATLRKIKAMGERLEQRIIDYAKEKCKEQRELCDEARHYQTGVSSAPEPTFD